MNKYTYKIINNKRNGHIKTTHGIISTPTFMPVTTFGDKYPLDKLVQPYLKRLSQCFMVSYHYALQMKDRPNMPLFIDSGGFASLFEGSEIIDYKDYSTIITKEDEEIHPLKVLEFQEKQADIAATLDFIIPPEMDIVEARRRQKATIQNAFYALKNKKSDSLALFASLQCWDEKSARLCAKEYANTGFDGIGIGGLVPRAKDLEYLKKVVCSVRDEAPDIAIHVFGIGKSETIKTLLELGVDSFDSSSYIRTAVDIDTCNFPLFNPLRPLTSPHIKLFTALNNLHTVNSAFDYKE